MPATLESRCRTEPSAPDVPAGETGRDKRKKLSAGSRLASRGPPFRCRALSSANPLSLTRFNPREIGPERSEPAFGAPDREVLVWWV